ncbi:MAG: peptidoglycan editing factor PgeF [Deltaproteobacteria bacterium]|nr:peptidoglycan editing factor PgeF [Deltaproteobacteria bacterium]
MTLCIMRSVHGIKFVTAPILETDKITHAFLTRIGGIDGRNEDRLENIEGNTAKTSKVFGFTSSKLITVNQVHGDDIVIIDGKQSTAKGVCADAITTNLKGVPIGVLTADCLPVILFDPINTAVGIVHAGWRGTLKRIVSKTVSVMNKRWGSSYNQMLAGLGPCVGECCYNVGKDVVERFRTEFSDSRDFIKSKENEWHLNFKRANYNQLVFLGLLKKNIWVSRYCTSCRKDLFFSYRRDNKETGRQLSFVMIREGI